jgi:hypothetical protein
MITDGLVAFHDPANRKSYPGSGTTINDLSGNGNNLVTAYSPVFSGNNNGIFTYDGLNDYATATTVGVTNCTDPQTMAIWVRIPSAATWTNGYFGTIFASGGSYAGQYGLCRGTTNNQMVWYLRGQTGASATYFSVERDTWYYVVGTWSGTIGFVYVNGVLAGQAGGTLTGTWDSTNIVVALSRAFGGNIGNYMNGDVGITQYYNRQLSEAESLQNYLATRGRYI